MSKMPFIEEISDGKWMFKNGQIISKYKINQIYWELELTIYNLNKI